MPHTPFLSQEVEVLSREPLGGGYHRILLQAPEVSRRARPGQFVMLRPRPGTEPLLNRPYSFYDVDPGEGTITFLSLDFGIGSRLIGQAEAGSRLSLIGPLGNTFRPPDGKKPLYVAGGVGVAPFPHLARELGEGTLLFGGRTREAIVDLDFLAAAGLKVAVSTDDGSLGTKGLVTDLVRDVLREERDVAIYGCGPNPMLRALVRIALDEGIPCQVSIDQRMACGFGTCMGCMVRTRDGYRRVCIDGPVFDASELR